MVLLAIGLIFYFAYGIRKSKLALTSPSIPSLFNQEINFSVNSASNVTLEDYTSRPSKSKFKSLKNEEGEGENETDFEIEEEEGSSSTPQITSVNPQTHQKSVENQKRKENDDIDDDEGDNVDDNIDDDEFKEMDDNLDDNDLRFEENIEIDEHQKKNL